MKPASEAETNSQISPEGALEEVNELRGRYLDNLLNLESLNVADFYPPEVLRRQWEEVAESPELVEFMRHFSTNDVSTGGRFNEHVLGVFRDTKTGQLFAAPTIPTRPNTRQILLDMLAAANDLAPWSRFKGLKWEKGDMFFEPHLPNLFTFQRSWIIIYPPVLIGIVNGLGDPKYTNEQRKSFIIQDVSCIIHEAVHISNNPDLDFGGPHRVLAEIASTLTEYLAFPGKNVKMTKISNRAILLLQKFTEKFNTYDEALLIGMLIMARESGFLSDEDDPKLLTQGIQKWKAYVESHNRDDLEKLRRKYEEKYLISIKDEKLIPAILTLRQIYPNSLGHLSLIAWELLGK